MSQELITHDPNLSQAELESIYGAMGQNTSRSEIIISRLAMMQSKSPEIDDQLPGYEVGQIVDNTSREILSTKGKAPWLIARGVPEAELTPIHFLATIPVFKLPTEYIAWIKLQDRQEGDPRWRFKTLDAASPDVRQGCWPTVVPGGQWGRTKETRGKAPPVTDNCNWLILPIDHATKFMKGNFTVATFARTSSKCGKTLTTAVSMHRSHKILPWGRVYYLYTKKETYKEGTCYVFQMAPGPNVHEFCPDLLGYCTSMAKELAHPVTGKDYQEAMINAAEIGDEHADDTLPSSMPDDVAASAGTPAGEDPFAVKSEGTPSKEGEQGPF